MLKYYERRKIPRGVGHLGEPDSRENERHEPKATSTLHTHSSSDTIPPPELHHLGSTTTLVLVPPNKTIIP